MRFTMDTLVYVGTYSTRGSEGIYACRMNRSTGELTPIGAFAAGKNPSFLAIEPGQRFLYSVSEVSDLDGKPGGGVRAFAVERESGGLRALNVQSTRGTGPCHLSVDSSSRCVLVANYSGGSVTALPVGEDGRLGEAACHVQHPAPAIPRERQEAAHAHSIMVDPAGSHALVPDLGLNRIVSYGLDPQRASLTPHDPPSFELHPGAGPRHLAFHPTGRFAYVINELDNTLCAYRYDGDGGLEYLQRLPALPEGWSGTSYCADIHVSPDGRHVYGSNRGHDSIVIFAVDEKSGALSLVGHESTRGNWPRSFALDPWGTFLYVANQETDSIVCFARDERSGRLTASGRMLSVPAPCCLKILAPL